METNFFKQLSSLNFNGYIQLTVAKGSSGNLVVSTIVLNDKIATPQATQIPPFNLNGDAESIDKMYFERLSKPIETTSEVIDNAQSYNKQLEAVKNKENKSLGTGSKKVDTKEYKYSKLMENVNSLDKQGKPREAWTALPKIEEFPEHSEEIKKRRSELSAQFSPSLFDTPKIEEKKCQQMQVDDLECHIEEDDEQEDNLEY